MYSDKNNSREFLRHLRKGESGLNSFYVMVLTVEPLATSFSHITISSCDLKISRTPDWAFEWQAQRMPGSEHSL